MKTKKMTTKKLLKQNRRTWEIDPSVRITPNSKIYKKKDRKYDYKKDLEEFEELEEDET